MTGERFALSFGGGATVVEIGQSFLRYRILEKIGEGGMGEVFLAQDQTLDRRVALKLLPQELRQDETARKRFLREAKSAAALDHPYICKIYETGEAEGQPFIAMEYVRGETLERRLARGALPITEAQRIASEIAEALETAHREDIVHRDLKPSNIMLTEDGHAKVMDFGLAKRVVPTEGRDSEFETASRLTGEGSTPGTLAYMSPEQLRGGAVDTRTDIFSFGLVLYEMLAGAHPFSKTTSVDTAARILTQEPDSISRYRKEVPERLEHVVEKMLAKDVGERYQLVHDVRTDLGRVRQASAPAPTRRLPLGLAGVAVLVFLAATVWWLVSSRGDLPGRELSSVAVLPLTNVSDDPLESDYLAQGITRAVITKLTQAGLRVTPWNTASRYGHSSQRAEDIARELNVEAVLVGTFELVGDRILTTLSLVEARSGLQSWAAEFEEPYEDIFRMQRRIATGAATSLRSRLTGEEEEALATPESRSVDAYDFYMQGAHMMQEGGEEATNVAFEYFTRAVELDPGLAEAHVGLGAVYAARYWFGWGGLNTLDRAEASYEKALRLSSHSMRARRGLVMVYFYRGRTEQCLIQGQLAGRSGRRDDVETVLTRAEAYLFGGLGPRALPLLRQAITLDPRNAEAFLFLLIQTWGPRSKDAVQAGNEFLRLFGDYHEVHNYLAFAHQFLGNYERAREHYEKAITLSPPGEPNFESLVFAGILLDELGERERAEEVWRRGVEELKPRLEVYPDNSRMRSILACFYGLLGERAAFVAEEKRALEAAEPNAWELHYLMAVHARLGDTERATELLASSVQPGRLPSYWRGFLRLAFAPPMESERFDGFVKDYEAELQRLQAKY